MLIVTPYERGMMTYFWPHALIIVVATLTVYAGAKLATLAKANSFVMDASLGKQRIALEKAEKKQQPPKNSTTKKYRTLKDIALYGGGACLLFTAIIYAATTDTSGSSKITVPPLVGAILYTLLASLFIAAFVKSMFMGLEASRQQKASILLVAVVVLSAWAFMPGWIGSNLAGAALCVTVLFATRPHFSFMVLFGILMVVAYGYDVPHVFFTERMLDLAQPSIDALSNASNASPQQPAASTAPVVEPHWFVDFVSKLSQPSLLSAPGQLAVDAPPVTILGLGDVLYPAPLAIAAALIDRKTGKSRLLPAALLGYVVGLCVSTYFAQTFQHAQPALMYIIPATGLAVMITARLSGNWQQLSAKHYTVPAAPPEKAVATTA